MRKTAIVLLAMLMLAGCGRKTVVPGMGDFSLEMPAGYVVSDVADLNCRIIRTGDDAAVGGMEYTELKHRDVYGKKSDNIMLYLQDVFHQTYDVEYITTHWGNKNKIISVNLKKHTDDGQEEQFTHIFFERDQVIYHIWLDADEIDADAAKEFMAITGVD